ncbi:MAG: succinylglutamate desuccinylase/aspartoacylase family protein [Bacteroidia bacterium]|nr:succinylglutamate desuccinylase/aspartoacylase family protein [Bacteroidia bacterium]NND52631.1 aspartoacylase [Flavobacteriaceae bacterium]
MVQVYNKALNETINVDRFIGKIEGSQSGPTIIFFAGIHGNETAGVFALHQVFNSIDKGDIRGSVYGIAGNLSALNKGQRFLYDDLNRIWTEKNIQRLHQSDQLNPDEKELLEIHKILKDILNKGQAPFYFIDLHTTSSQTLPFVTINDALINRKFSRQFPVPIVLGIEEYLDGPLLSYLNTKGYVSIGFESGQHDMKNAITNGEAFIYLSLVHSGSIKKASLPDYDRYFNLLKQDAKEIKEVFEIIYLYQLSNGEDFRMKPDFKSFQLIKKGTLLAQRNGKDVVAPKDAKIFMPLYQNRGREGFFLIKKISPFFLRLSAILRRTKADNLLAILPGISWQDEQKNGLQVDLKIARFMAKPIFHLLGYRNKQLDRTHLRLNNRERNSKIDAYRNLPWYKGQSN